MPHCRYFNFSEQLVLRAIFDIFQQSLREKSFLCQSVNFCLWFRRVQTVQICNQIKNKQAHFQENAFRKSPKSLSCNNHATYPDENPRAK